MRRRKKTQRYTRALRDATDLPPRPPRTTAAQPLIAAPHQRRSDRVSARARERESREAGNLSARKLRQEQKSRRSA